MAHLAAGSYFVIALRGRFCNRAIEALTSRTSGANSVFESHPRSAKTFQVVLFVQTDLLSRFGYSQARGYQGLHIAATAVSHLIGQIFCQLAFRDVRVLPTLDFSQFSKGNSQRFN